MHERPGDAIGLCAVVVTPVIAIHPKIGIKRDEFVLAPAIHNGLVPLRAEFNDPTLLTYRE